MPDQLWLSVTWFTVTAVNCRHDELSSDELSPINCRAIKCHVMKCRHMQYCVHGMCLVSGLFLSCHVVLLCSGRNVCLLRFELAQTQWHHCKRDRGQMPLLNARLSENFAVWKLFYKNENLGGWKSPIFGIFWQT